MSWDYKTLYWFSIHMDTEINLLDHRHYWQVQWSNRLDFSLRCMYLYLCKHNTVYERSILRALIKLHQHKHHVRGQQQEVRGRRRDDVTLGRGVAHIVTIPQPAKSHQHHQHHPGQGLWLCLHNKPSFLFLFLKFQFCASASFSIPHKYLWSDEESDEW